MKGETMKEKVKEVIEDLRKYLQMDGGDVELVDVDEATGEVKVKLTGACGGCPMAMITLSQGIEARLKEKVPEVKKVTAV
jgi:Fe-S cluster biogenesis protein NfuA